MKRHKVKCRGAKAKDPDELIKATRAHYTRAKSPFSSMSPGSLTYERDYDKTAVYATYMVVGVVYDLSQGSS